MTEKRQREGEGEGNERPSQTQKIDLSSLTESFDNQLETILKTILQNEIAAGQQGQKILALCFELFLRVE